MVGSPACPTFAEVVDDFRFVPAVEHVALYIAIWLVAMIVLVVGLALLVHGLRRRGLSGTLRLLYYVPGALAGASSVLLWLFMLDPGASPVGSLLRWLGYSSFTDTLAPGHLPVIFAIIAFWTGAGGWIVVMYGALNNISTEIMEAARVDGANACPDRVPHSVAPAPQVDRLHGRAVDRRRYAAVRRADTAVAG